MSAGVDGDDVFEALVRSTSLKTRVATPCTGASSRHDDDDDPMTPASSSPQIAAGHGRRRRDEDGESSMALAMPPPPPGRSGDHVRRKVDTVDDSVATVTAQTVVNKAKTAGTTTDQDYPRGKEEEKKQQPEYNDCSEFDIIAGYSSCARRRQNRGDGSAAAAARHSAFDVEKWSNNDKNRVVEVGRRPLVDCKTHRGTNSNRSERAAAATNVQRTFRGHKGRERAAAESRKLARRWAADVEHAAEREKQVKLKFGRLPRPAVPATFGF